MCYNCGCELPDDDHGSADNLTNADFDAAAKAVGQTPEEARRNTLSLLEKVDLASGKTS